MEQTKRRPGRPPVERRRIQMAMRITPELRDELVARAERKGRSITQEMEMLLEQALSTQHLLDQVFDLSYGDPKVIGMLLVMGESMRDTLTALGAAPDWIDDPATFDQVARAAREVVEGFRPEGEPPPPERPISEFYGGGGVLLGKDDKAKDGIIPGEAVARFVMFRVAGDWSQPFPWLTAVRSRIGATINRLRERSRGPKIKMLRGSWDLFDFMVGMGIPVKGQPK